MLVLAEGWLVDLRVICGPSVSSGVVLASKSFGFNFADGVNECFLSLGVRGQVHHVADHDPDRRFTVLRLLNPLFHLLEAASFGHVEHVDAGG